MRLSEGRRVEGGADKLINMSFIYVKRLQACRPASNNKKKKNKPGTTDRWTETERWGGMCFYSNIFVDPPPTATVVYLKTDLT